MTNEQQLILRQFISQLQIAFEKVVLSKEKDTSTQTLKHHFEKLSSLFTVQNGKSSRNLLNVSRNKENIAPLYNR